VWVVVRMGESGRDTIENNEVMRQGLDEAGFVRLVRGALEGIKVSQDDCRVKMGSKNKAELSQLPNLQCGQFEWVCVRWDDCKG